MYCFKTTHHVDLNMRHKKGKVDIMFIHGLAKKLSNTIYHILHLVYTFMFLIVSGIV